MQWVAPLAPCLAPRLRYHRRWVVGCCTGSSRTPRCGRTRCEHRRRYWRRGCVVSGWGCDYTMPLAQCNTYDRFTKIHIFVRCELGLCDVVSEVQNQWRPRMFGYINSNLVYKVSPVSQSIYLLFVPDATFTRGGLTRHHKSS